MRERKVLCCQQRGGMEDVEGPIVWDDAFSWRLLMVEFFVPRVMEDRSDRTGRSEIWIHPFDYPFGK